jgi:hypothetical protein
MLLWCVRVCATWSRVISRATLMCKSVPHVILRDLCMLLWCVRACATLSCVISRAILMCKNVRHVILHDLCMLLWCVWACVPFDKWRGQEGSQFL